MYESYYDSAEGIVITCKRALAELSSHGVIDTSEFFEELGYHSEYDAQEVLAFLGY